MYIINTSPQLISNLISINITSYYNSFRYKSEEEFFKDLYKKQFLDLIEKYDYLINYFDDELKQRIKILKLKLK